jgi:hypothetical protein
LAKNNLIKLELNPSMWREGHMHNERKLISAIFVFILLLSIFLPLSGCGSSSGSPSSAPTQSTAVSQSSTSTQPIAASQSSGNILVKSADGSVSLSVPSGWNTNDTALYPGSIVGVGDATRSEYVVITKRAKTVIGADSTISDYMGVVKTVFSGILTNPVWGQASDIKIGGCSGTAAQVSGTKKSDNSKVVYFVNALASKNYFYNVCGWTTDALADTNKASIENIVQSFKETD